LKLKEIFSASGLVKAAKDLAFFIEVSDVSFGRV
jgi:hypothetical protein